MRTTTIGGQEFVIDPYKEPLVQLKGAVKGYMRGTLPYAVSDGRLPCAFCDPGSDRGTAHSALGFTGELRIFDSLVLHVRRTHGLSAQEYRDRIGLLPTTPLVSRRLSMSPHYAKSGNNEGFVKGRHIITAEDRAKVKRLRYDSPEYQNKENKCHDQLVAQATEISKAHGGHLPRFELDRRHIGPGSLRRAGFEGFRALAVEAGATYQPRYHTEAELIQELREAATELGRTPSLSEFGRRGANLIRRFGSYSEACRRAGLPPNLPRPISEGDEIDVLNRYALGQGIHDLGTATHHEHHRIRAILEKYGVPTPRLGASERERRDSREFAATITRRLSGMADDLVKSA